MEGLGRGRQFPLHVQREFAAFRLEKQILVRVFELVVPLICRRPAVDQQSTVGLKSKDKETLAIAKGA